MGQVADIIAHKADNQKMSDKMSEIVSGKMSDKLNEKEKIFLNLLTEQLKSQEYVTITLMAGITEIPASTVGRYMNKLCKLKVIEAERRNIDIESSYILNALM